MFKKSTIGLALFLMLSGCTQQPAATENTPTNNHYVSKNLGVEFDYVEGIPATAFEEGNKIMHPDYPKEIYIAVFVKKENESIQEAILNGIEQEMKNTKDCKVVETMKYESGNIEYKLDLANPAIIYTAAEKEKIKKADEEAKKDGSPFDGEWKKKEIYNRRLVEKCSKYAEPLGLGTSKSMGSHFLYNDAISKTKFIHIPEAVDPYFHEYGTIKFLPDSKENLTTITVSGNPPEESNLREYIKSVTGVLEVSKGNIGVISGIFMTGMDSKDLEKYKGKKVTVTGKTKVEEGTCPENNSGEIVQCYEGDRTEMYKVTNIQLAQ